LSVGHDLSISGIDSRVISILGVAGFKDLVNGSVRSVEGATNAIIDVFTEVSGIGTSRVTGLQAESVATEEAEMNVISVVLRKGTTQYVLGPFNDLLGTAE